MTQVSVILATYNRKDDLLECVDSILGQTYRDFEIILLDDGSNDGSASAFLDRWSAVVCDSDEAEEFLSDPIDHGKLSFCIDGIPVHYIARDNRGCSKAFNCGLKIARGNLICFTNPEVRWMPTRLEKQVRSFRRKTPVVISISGLIPLRNGRPLKKPVFPGEGGWLFPDVINDDYLPYTTALIDYRCFERIGGFDENLPNCEDFDLWVRLTANFPVHTVQESLLYAPFRNRNGQGSWGAHRYRVYALEKAFQSGYLIPQYRRMVAEQIVVKCEKLVSGFQKKNNSERANFYERKRRKFASEVRKLKASTPKPKVAEKERDLLTSGVS
jgi:glycosyltransferase involved in cell wall biosynthesis